MATDRKLDIFPLSPFPFPLPPFLFPLGRNARLLLSSFFLGFFFWADLAGETLIFPPAALSDLAKLGSDRIQARWKPRSIPDGYFPVVEGYYVVYNHENLSLFFGPVPDERDAIRTQDELTRIRSDLISRNPALSSSTIGRIRINFGENPSGGQNRVPPTGLKPVRVHSGDSTLELGQAESEGSAKESPTSSIHAIADETSDSSGRTPGEEPAGANNESLQEAANNPSSPQPPKGGSTVDETRNSLGKFGLLRIIPQGGTPANEDSESEEGEAPPERGLQALNTSGQDLGERAVHDGNNKEIAQAVAEEEREIKEGKSSSETLSLEEPVKDNREPVIAPPRLRAEPSPENAPDALAQTNAPTPSEPESKKSKILWIVIALAIIALIVSLLALR